MRVLSKVDCTEAFKTVVTHVRGGTYIEGSPHSPDTYKRDGATLYVPKSKGDALMLTAPGLMLTGYKGESVIGTQQDREVLNGLARRARVAATATKVTPL